jgi:hypothetical protein
MDEADGPVSKPLAAGVAQAAGRTSLLLRAPAPLLTRTFAQTDLSLSLFACNKAAEHTFQVAPAMRDALLNRNP